MNKQAIWHQAKSEFSYQYDETTLHIILRCAKNDCKNVSLIYGDPFDWIHDGSKSRWNSCIDVMKKRYTNDLFDYFFIEVKPKDLRCKYAFFIENDNHRYLYGAKRMVVQDTELKNEFDNSSFFDLSNYFNYPFLNKEDLNETPSWVKETIWYQIFPDRFYSNNNQSKLTWGKLPVNNNEFYGGNLKGIKDKLQYLKDLGISGIYFTPIFEAPTAHKYDTKDYFKIDPQFGSNEDFKDLVDSAHKLGIKVVLDGVFNHCGYEHPFWQDVLKNEDKSPYFDCFHIDRLPVVNYPVDASGKPNRLKGVKLNFKTFAYTPYMPKWNTANEIARKHLLDCVDYWIREYDIDGWRLDVSNEISHDFLRELKKTARKAKKETFIFGENWDSSIPWLRGDQMDAVMNYDLMLPLLEFFEDRINLHEFKNEIANYCALTPKNVMENMFNLLDSHDTVRIKRRLKDDPRRVKLAFAFMFLSSGAPNIYYGTEIGLTGDHDPDNRRCFDWNEKNWDLDFYGFLKRLIQLRKTHKAMSDYDYYFIDDKSLSFLKKSDDETLLLLGNHLDQSLEINLQEDLQGQYINLIDDTTINLEKTITLDNYQTLILKRIVK